MMIIAPRKIGYVVECTQLFLRALIQISLVSMNVVFITHDQILMMFITGFFISYLWTFNVRSISVSDNFMRVMYASGAAAGSVIGYYLAKLLI